MLKNNKPQKAILFLRPLGDKGIKPKARRSSRSVGGGGLVFFAVLFLFGFVGFFAFTGGGAGR
jgi:hypothetical protein